MIAGENKIRKRFDTKNKVTPSEECDPDYNFKIKVLLYDLNFYTAFNAFFELINEERVNTVINFTTIAS